MNRRAILSPSPHTTIPSLHAQFLLRRIGQIPRPVQMYRRGTSRSAFPTTPLAALLTLTFFLGVQVELVHRPRDDRQGEDEADGGRDRYGTLQPWESVPRVRDDAERECQNAPKEE